MCENPYGVSVTMHYFLHSSKSFFEIGHFKNVQK